MLMRFHLASAETYQSDFYPKSDILSDLDERQLLANAKTGRTTDMEARSGNNSASGPAAGWRLMELLDDQRTWRDGVRNFYNGTVRGRRRTSSKNKNCR